MAIGRGAGEKDDKAKAMIKMLEKGCILRAISVLLFLLSGGIISAQNEVLISSKLQSHISDIPQDQVFMHIDRNVYKGGDSLFFQTYIRDRFTGKFETSSIAFYVMLFDHNGVLADSARFRIENALAEGWLRIPADAREGAYRITGFTGPMQNYDPAFAFSQTISVRKALVEPPMIGFAYDKSEYLPGETAEVVVSVKGVGGVPLSGRRINYSLKAGGKSVEDAFTKTNDEGSSLIRIKLPDTLTTGRVDLEISVAGIREIENLVFANSVPVNNEPGELIFLPEGGTFIAGVPQRLAVNALSKAGKPLQISGMITNSSKTFEIPFSTGKYGTGTVELTPGADEQLFAKLNRDEGGRQWPLPLASEVGVSLSAACTGTGRLNIGVRSTSGYSGRYLVAFTMNNHLVAYRETESVENWQLSINTSELPRGAGRITLFDRNLNPLAERIIFINSEKRPVFSVSADNSLYGPGQKAVLTLDLHDSSGNRVAGIVSVAVTDSLLATDGNHFIPDIDNRFTCEPYLTTRLPSAIRSARFSEMSNSETDEIMMIYGWKSFSWEPLLSSPVKQKEMILYDLLRIVITGQTTLRRSAGDLMLYTLEDIDIMPVKSDERGEFMIPFEKLPSTAYNLLATAVKTGNKRITAVRIDVPSSTPFLTTIKQKIQVQKSDPPEGTISHESLDFINPDDIKQIGEVLITANRNRTDVYKTEVEERYQYANLKTMHREELSLRNTFEELLLGFHPYKIDYGTKRLFIRPGRGMNAANPPPALFVVDGTPLDTSYEMIATYTTDQIYSVSMLSGQQGFAIYGQDAVGGVVFVSTVGANIGKMSAEELAMLNSRAGDLGKPYELFRSRVDFYVPAVEEAVSSSAMPVRPTLYWNPGIVLDGEGPVKIEFPNHQHRGVVNIIINGVSLTHQPFSGTGRYVIR
jgi:alpha-2-macroglobulin-like protein